MVLISVGVLLVGVSAVRRALVGSSEFREFREIVQVSIAHDKVTHEPRNIPHIRAYPPFFSIAWAPFGSLPWGTHPHSTSPLQDMSVFEVLQFTASAALFVLVATAFVFLAAWCAVEASRPAQVSPSPRGADYALPLLLSIALMLASIARCETDMIVVMAIAGAMFLMLRKGKDFVAGGLLGFAAAFKLTPGLFAIYLLSRRKWKALGGMIAGVVLCTVVLPTLVWGVEGNFQRHKAWAEVVLLPVLKGEPDFIGHVYRSINQSPTAALHRFLSHYNAGSSLDPSYVNFVDLDPAVVRTIAGVLKALILGILLIVWARGSPDRQEAEVEAALFGTVPLGMLLLSDVSLTTHAAVLLVPYAGLLGSMAAQPESKASRVVSWGVLAAFVLTSLAAIRGLKHLSVITVGIMVLFSVSIYALTYERRHRRLGG